MNHVHKALPLGDCRLIDVPSRRVFRQDVVLARRGRKRVRCNVFHPILRHHVRIRSLGVPLNLVGCSEQLDELHVRLLVNVLQIKRLEGLQVDVVFLGLESILLQHLQDDVLRSLPVPHVEGVVPGRGLHLRIKTRVCLVRNVREPQEGIEELQVPLDGLGLVPTDVKVPLHQVDLLLQCRHLEQAVVVRVPEIQPLQRPQLLDLSEGEVHGEVTFDLFPLHLPPRLPLRELWSRGHVRCLLERQVVPADRNPVLGQDNVALDAVCTLLDRQVIPLEGVFRHHPTASPVSNHKRSLPPSPSPKS
mmetsp:Transcript_13198/g.25095  ORF Transcript_13198/g.25095 Transcript_13198/m.25095 type:complete len:304 (+) Transcript_13198:244-1155(+)